MLINGIAAFLGEISRQRHLIAVRRGLSFNMPIIVIGSFAIILNYFPLVCYQQFMQKLFGPAWLVLGQSIWNGSFAVISILLVLSISYFLADSHRLINSGAAHPLMASIVSFSCLMAIMQPFNVIGVVGLPVKWTGTHGLFLAILVALIATELFLRLCAIRKVNIVIFSDEADSTISQAMSCIVPAAATVAAFALLKLGAASLGVTDIHRYVYSLFEQMFTYSHNNLGVAVAFVGMTHSLWFFGLHGNNILEPVTQNLYVSAGLANMKMIAAGGQPTEIFTKTFFDSFVFLGGSGATLCLIFALLIVSRRSNTLRLAKLSLLPAILNVNELLIFGLPIVLNPIYLIPFLLVPLVLTISSYLALATGCVNLTVASVEWTTPPLISGFLATGSWGGTVLQFFNILIGTLIYLPFVRLAEAQKAREAKQALTDFYDQVEYVQEKITRKIITRHDSVGNLARILANDLKQALKNDKLVLEYQPQLNSDNVVFGMEALLRWPHGTYGRIPPPVIISIAEEAGLMHELGRWIIDRACRQLSLWKKSGLTDICMAINVSAVQVQDGRLADDILAAIKANDLMTGDIEIEITENATLSCGARTIEILERIYNMGARIAVDDYGQGYSSLQYIKIFPIDTLKIDRSLSIDVLEDKGSQEIIASIVTLCNSLDINVIVEYVETEAQLEKLKHLGCNQFQGYLFSPSLPPEKAAEYIRSHNTTVLVSLD